MAAFDYSLAAFGYSLAAFGYPMAALGYSMAAFERERGLRRMKPIIRKQLSCAQSCSLKLPLNAITLCDATSLDT
jgi:hypothetical protein